MPAASSAAATLSPARAAIGAPSKWMVTPRRSGEASGGRANMEPSRVEGGERLGQGAVVDGGGDALGVQGREGNAGMAGRDEGAWVALRLRVDRIAVGRQRPQRA